MKRNMIYIGVKKATMRIAASCLLLFFLAGNALAQTEGQFVIKKKYQEGDGTTVHYLSHAGNTLQDATAFSPDCLWTSDNHFTQGGTNKNYYYYDGANYRFLGAPQFEEGASLSLSTSLPPTSYLNNPESQYYFYKWDGGLGRGVQYFGDCATNQAQCETCGHVWGDGQCWDVYWVSYNGGAWKLSEKQYDLDDVPYGAKFHAVTVTEHAQEITTISGGLADLEEPFEMVYSASPLTQHELSASVSEYQYSLRPAYDTYVFDGTTHHYYSGSDHTTIPDATNHTTALATEHPYSWTISGEGEPYLSFASESNVNTSDLATPFLYYRVPNDTGHKQATITLTVTYADGTQQTKTTTVLVKTPCQNPVVLHSDVVITYVGVTISWLPTAEEYRVYWKKRSESSWNYVTVGDVTSYTITGLEYETDYDYKVQATCDGTDPTTYTFTTLAEPGLMITGAIFGGGRMADVGTESGGGDTEIIIINCDSIGAIYGGNDIAGKVHGLNGSKITLGVKADDPNGYDTYGTTPSNASLKFGSVYGGGNGYYAYNGTSFVPASSSYTSETVADGSSVRAMTQSNEVGEVVWTNTIGTSKTLEFPSIVKTAITVSDNYVKADSIFGGAKNAFVTHIIGESNGNPVYATNGSSINVNGGTIMAVFGGNNFGGTQGYGKHYIDVRKTTINLVPNIVNTPTEGYGRTFGIRYIFGGGNKVDGSTTDVRIYGGQLDEVFAGGNAADVYKGNVTVDCTLGANAGNNITFGNTYTNAIVPSNYTSGTIGENTLNANYAWDGVSGIYNVRTLYGGNNEAEMTRLPSINLAKGSVGTVYGGGNAGDMMGQHTDGTTNSLGHPIKYGTYVELNSDKILIDYIYGGCRMSNVANSTKVKLLKGHVGYVYGGCNISGDVGSTRVYDPYPSGHTYPQNLVEQEVKGATYVEAGDGTSANTTLIVYKDLFAGSNGYYHCNNGVRYIEGTNFTDQNYVGEYIPTHNETNVFVNNGATIKGNVYAGGNLAPVGFDDGNGFNRGFPELVGMASVLMNGGEVVQNVYGGGNMASIYGENSVRVTGGTIGVALYGGNDRAGQVAEKTNRILPEEYTIASDGWTSLTDLGVKTYVGVSGNAQIGTVYGGGNGDYVYGGETGIPFCGTSPDKPIQPHTFVDININGGETVGTNGGHIGMVYGGGNGVTIRHGATVFLNVKDPVNTRKHVDTIFGGNNKGDLAVVPNILLLHGQVGTVYGGCNRGAMTASGDNLKTIGDYDEIGSYVRLMDKYVVVTDNTTTPPTTHEETVTAKITEAIYGGCRMNGVTNNSLVLVEGGDFNSIPIFGGSDISGTVEGKSMVAVVDGAVGNVYGGGNGNYTYTLNGETYDVYVGSNMIASGVLGAPTCVNSGADILGGTLGATGSGNQRNVFGGGYGQMTNTTGNVEVNIGAIAYDGDENEIHTDYPLLYGGVYGGSALGSVHNTLVNVLNGVHHGNVYGGGLGQASPEIAAAVTGNVVVNIGKNNSGTLLGFAEIDGDVFGANNIKGSPAGSITVNVYKGTMNNVYGGGNLSATSVSGSYPAVNFYGGSTDNIYGGGKAADVTGNPTVLVQGGTVSTGVYGGCNTSGTISGNTSVTLTGGTIGTAEADANVHGGGYGEPTVVTGNVNVTFGADNDIYNENLILYGDLYGGSAFGNVNTYNDDKTTTIDVFNGIIVGNVFGGGLGADGVEAKVYGKIHVNIGKMITHLDTGEDPTFSGKANLNNCSVYGCNNVNGSPKDDVYVDVYNTYRRPSDEVDAVGEVTYAILNVFGGGNRANYSPQATQKTHVYVHGCENTAEFLYAGGNAADAYGVEIVVEGGRFNEAYGGGNGLVVPANIGGGGIGYNFHGGHYGFTYEGSNKNGGNSGDIMDPPPSLLPEGESVECGGSFTDSHFFGANQAEIYVDVLENIIRCEDAESYHYKNVYAGSRWAIIYGDVKLTVCGGEIENLFGGSQGYRSSPTNPNGFSADIRKYPTFQQIYEDEQAHSNVDERKYSQALKDHMGYTGNPNAPQPDYAGQGGNIILIVNGGAIGNVIGGCNAKGNVEGKITVIVEDAEANTCELLVGNVFGASNEAVYEPTGTDGTDSPKVTIIKGTLGMEHDFNSNGVINEGERFEGNVFGGGNRGDITATPKVIVGDGTTGEDATRVSIGGSVYGGGDEGNVTGSANVIVVPVTHKLTVTTPDAISTNPTSANIVSVTNSLGQDMNNQFVGEGHVLMIQAIPSPYGYKFDHWEFTNGTVANPNKAVTTFTVGTDEGNATITAHFATVSTHKLTYSSTGGTVKVYNGQGNEVPNDTDISEGAVLSIVARPADVLHEFHEWTYTNGTVTNTSSPSTTFTMGTDEGNATITAVFSVITDTHTLEFVASPGNGTFTVKDAQGNTLTSPATVGEGVTLNIDVDPTSITPGYAFIKWEATTASLGNEAAPSTTLRMGAGNASLAAVFAQTYTFSVTAPVNGTVRVLDGEGNVVNNNAPVGAGATLHLKATPIAGYAFKQWTIEPGGNGTFGDTRAANTTFTMGAANTTITATFVPTHTLTLTPPQNGSVKITNTIGGRPVTVTCPASIGVGATLQLKATPVTDYRFVSWTITGTGSDVENINAAETTFTMGSADTNIQANFEHE